ncbi:MAG: choline kinase family protein [Woeseiaceae bacterium]|nr:choline kinase family protein [Woeseiaceae bacterium]
MSRELDPGDALQCVPHFGNARVTARLGGLSNRSFMVERGGERFVLRLDAAHTDALCIDREAELAALERAAARDLGPAVVFADADAGILLTRLLPGAPLDAAALEDASVLERVADLLRLVHALDPIGKPLRAAEIARAYYSRLPAEWRRQPAAAASLAVIEAQDTGSGLCICHNDVNAANLIDGDRLRLVDWEYACDNEPLFDLAALCGFHELGDAAVDILLSAYTGGSTAAWRERLQGQRARYDALCWLWFALRQTISPDAAIERRLDALGGRLRRSG